MNEVTKLYKNAGVEPEKKCYYWDCPYSTGMPANDISYAERNCQDCNNPDKAVYPPFTAEKQLELIKWFVINNAELETLEITYYSNDCFQISSCVKSSHFETNFEEALAGLINSLWQDLTDGERKQIRNILAEVSE